MPDFKSKLEKFFERAEGAADKFSLKRRQKRNFENPLKIVPFFGYGTSEKIRIKGRVLEDEGAIVSRAEDSVWRNIANMYRRFETDEIPFARVKAFFQNIEIETQADDEGYFTAEFSNLEIASEKLWHEVGFELLEPVSIEKEKPFATGSFLTSVPTSKFGVISDIDDTVMATNVLNRLKMLITTIAANEHTRIPFEGVAAFYRALQKGASGAENNPIFYVSSSPWNLYGFLIEFMRKHNIPFGPLFLKDFGSHTIFNSGDHAGHKLENITHILETFRHLPFVLIGDSGEKDPEIYRKIIEQFPNRIRAVYIRNVNPHPERIESVNKLITEINEVGSQLVFAPDSEFAARHAAEAGLIAPEELANIRIEKKIDENAPTAAEMIKDEII
ncbi:App1 family protein [soil metagenome]